MTACAGPQISTDYDPEYQFTDLTSFYLVEMPRDRVSDITAARINAAIRASMAARGIKETDKESAKVWVNYLVVTQDKTRVRTYNTRHGYNCYRCWGAHRGTEVDVRNYTEGSLILDLINPETKKTIWRGMRSKVVNPNRTPEERTQLINEYTDSIIGRMPI